MCRGHTISRLCICFCDGVSAALVQVRANYTNTVSQIKRILGRKFSEPDVQHEIENFLGYKVIQQDDDEIGIQVRCRPMSCS
jgi:molecular chaperone DnaK (HSP70)